MLHDDVAIQASELAHLSLENLIDGGCTAGLNALVNAHQNLIKQPAHVDIVYQFPSHLLCLLLRQLSRLFHRSHRSTPIGLSTTVAVFLILICSNHSFKLFFPGLHNRLLCPGQRPPCSCPDSDCDRLLFHGSLSCFVQNRIVRQLFVKLFCAWTLVWLGDV